MFQNYKSPIPPLPPKKKKKSCLQTHSVLRLKNNTVLLITPPHPPTPHTHHFPISPLFPIPCLSFFFTALWPLSPESRSRFKALTPRRSDRDKSRPDPEEILSSIEQRAGIEPYSSGHEIITLSSLKLLELPVSGRVLED